MKNIIKKVLIGIVCLIVLAVLYLFIEPLMIRHSYVEIENMGKWMARVGDDVFISDIYIPGTHDSGSECADLAYFSKCQSSGIDIQLKEGYRYLDVRLEVSGKEDDKELVFCHGFCKCRKGPWPWSPVLGLEEVLNECYAFLDANPTETIIFAVKMEQGDDVKTFQELLHSYIDKDPGRWYLGDSIPRLAECRGRLVLFRRYEDACGYGKQSGIQLFWEDQGNKTDTGMNAAVETVNGYTLIVQDRYKYNAADKWKAFTAGLEKSTTENADLRISFLSTNGPQKFGHPYTHARVLNKNFMTADLSEYAPSWIILDFSDSVKAQLIYDLNFR